MITLKTKRGIFAAYTCRWRWKPLWCSGKVLWSFCWLFFCFDWLDEKKLLGAVDKDTKSKTLNAAIDDALYDSWVMNGGYDE